MGDNIRRLASVLDHRSKETAHAALPSPYIEWGLIHDDRSLSTDSGFGPIPKNDYLTLYGAVQPLPGDRVLAAWCGHQVLILGIVIPGPEHH